MKAFVQKIGILNIVLIFASIMMASILAVNVTAAFFFGTSSSSSIIIISNLDISAQFVGQPNGGLPNIKTNDLIPGNRILRTLRISNIDFSEDAFIRVKAEFEINRGSGYEKDLAVQMQIAEGQTGVTQGKTGPEFWLYLNTALLEGQSRDINLEFVIFPTQANDQYGLSPEDMGKPYRIKVYVMAVQEHGDAYLIWADDSPNGWPTW